MRYLLLVTMMSVIAVPAFADRINKDEQSPELKQCIEGCKNEKETTAHEECLIKCAKADKERLKQKAGTADKK